MILPRDSQALFLVQRIRDETHRFAITFHRQKRGKSALKSSLDDLPGIGPARKKALLLHFGSPKRIREATVEELMAGRRHLARAGGEDSGGIVKGGIARMADLAVGAGFKPVRVDGHMVMWLLRTPGRSQTCPYITTAPHATLLVSR